MGFFGEAREEVKDELKYRAKRGVVDGITDGVVGGVRKLWNRDSAPQGPICPKCKAKLEEGVKFCKACGAKVVASCKECGTDYPLGTKFCEQCGKPLK